jgi:ATP-dependent Clp protease ATP-binding subunit ClpC
MLERFSDQACRVVVQAGEEARALNHNWIGTEHLMLGLIGEGSGMAAQVLESLAISIEAARWLVEQGIGRGERPPSGQLQFTPRARKVLELASGLSHGYDHVGSWHILLGLLREGDGVGAIVLFTLGADQYRVGLRVGQLLRGDRGNEASGEGSSRVRGHTLGCSIIRSRGSTCWIVGWLRSSTGWACNLTSATWTNRQ